MTALPLPHVTPNHVQYDVPRSQVDVYALGHEVNDSALATATSAPHCAALSPAPHSDVALDDASWQCCMHVEPDKQDAGGHAMSLP